MGMHMEREIERLKKQILGLCALVEESVRMAVTALERRDVNLADQVTERDLEIDRMEIEVEEECLKILALHQPVAVDLRFIIAVLKINNDLERVGDLAVNIAKQARFIGGNGTAGAPFDFTDLCQRVLEMLRASLDALTNMDAARARRVLDSDDEVDEINSRMHDLGLEAIRAEPVRARELFSYIVASRGLERIADYSTNIAEDVIYMIEGSIVRHRGDA